MRILYAEDEKQLSAAVTAVLKHNNFSVDAVYDGQDAVDWALSLDYDVIILDIMMPKLDGIEALREIRGHAINTPVLLLTAKSQIEDRVSGLDAGADDYLSKPFSMDELMARVRALGRRAQSYTHSVLTMGNTSLDRSSFLLSTESGGFTLGNKEFQILEMLMSANGTTVSPDRIFDSVWGLESDSDTNIVWVYISYIRKKLKTIGSDIEIIVSRGQGYYLRNSDG